MKNIKKMINDEPMEYESGLRNLKWYQENIIEIHCLENSRWETMYPWNRCGEIKDYIEIRAGAISQYLNETDYNIEVE